MNEKIIPVSNPKAQYIKHKQHIDSAIEKVLSCGWYILGHEVKLFEEEFAVYLNTEFCTGVASGTDALILALKAAEILPEDEVITVSHSAVATVAAIEQAGAVPVFVDIDPLSRCIDPEKIIPLISPKTKAVLPVHIYGQPAPMKEIMAIAKEYNLKIIEDCAQAHGAEIDGKKVGTFGDAGAFSFYPTKNLGAIGDGGAVVTASEHIKERLLLLRQYGWKKRYISQMPGMNSRLDEIQAAILRIKLFSLEEDNKKRREIAERYVDAMKGKIVTTPAKLAGTLHAMHLFVIETDKRDEMQMYLKSQHIGTAIHYPYAIHEQPAYAGRIRGSDNLPVTERLYRKCLTLPLYPEMNEEDIEKIVKALEKWEP